MQYKCKLEVHDNSPARDVQMKLRNNTRRSELRKCHSVWLAIAIMWYKSKFVLPELRKCIVASLVLENLVIAIEIRPANCTIALMQYWQLEPSNNDRHHFGKNCARALAQVWQCWKSENAQLHIVNFHCTGGRLNSAYIGLKNNKPIVGKSITVLDYTLCGQCPNPAPSSTFSVRCRSGTKPGRYLIVQQNDAVSTDNALSINAVEVYLNRESFVFILTV